MRGEGNGLVSEEFGTVNLCTPYTGVCYPRGFQVQADARFRVEKRLTEGLNGGS